MACQRPCVYITPKSVTCSGTIYSAVEYLWDTKWIGRIVITGCVVTINKSNILKKITGSRFTDYITGFINVSSYSTCPCTCRNIKTGSYILIFGNISTCYNIRLIVSISMSNSGGSQGKAGRFGAPKIAKAST